MKTNFPIAFLVLIACFFVGCRDSGKVENDKIPSENTIVLSGNAQHFPIDVQQSVISWKGGNLAGSNTHEGFIYVSKGELLLDENQLVGGNVEIDMNTIEDDKHEKKNGLVDHLKDPDFFDVKKFPTTTFAFTKIAATNGEMANVSGNLTIKGIANPVTFPAKIEVRNGIVEMTAGLVIDRTKWDIRYKSGKFYELLADQTISDNIEFTIKIVAKK